MFLIDSEAVKSSLCLRAPETILLHAGMVRSTAGGVVLLVPTVDPLA